MGTPTLQVSVPVPPSTKAKTKNNKKKKPPAAKCLPCSNAASTPPPVFVESPTPQQTNGYDCGIYVIAIARAICHWFHLKGVAKMMIGCLLFEDMLMHLWSSQCETRY
ncbi:conserved hypothetical protein [Ricinus communis]|uniref:Ubiquitin-like protease family profile domain-containing protein n=1 Tax=Ricinus communis TaxID=3988 RepID=B9S7W3_RICCO|nr:conserved hypothetical protein [Ricinus communis]